MIGSVAPARYPLATPFCPAGTKSIAQHGSIPIVIGTSCLISKSQIGGYGPGKVKSIYSPYLYGIEIQHPKYMEFKPLNIEKPNHNDWVVLVVFDLFFDWKIVGCCTHSHQSIIGKTVITSIGCQDDMVQYLDIKKQGGLLDFLGQLSVLLAGLQLSGGMVVSQDNTDG